MTSGHKVTQLDGECWLVRSNPDENAVWQGQVEQLAVPADENGTDLVILMMQLAKRNVNSIWVEAGQNLQAHCLS